MFSVTDTLTMDAPRKTADGYLVATAKFARTGLYDYAGSEVGKPEMDRVRVYRPEEEVFAEDAMASFAHRPLTNDHPAENVTAKSWKRQAVGFTDGRVARDDGFVIVPMMVTDQGTIDDIDNGKRELSAGYTCDLDFVPGQTPDGTAYDAVMRNIRGNHIAIVDRGRAGSECRIGDSFTPRETTTMTLKTILVDGLQVETTAAGEAAIVKLQDSLGKVGGEVATLRTELQTAQGQVAAKDGEIVALKAQLADAQDPVKLQAAAQARATLIDTAKRIVPAVAIEATMTDAQVRRAVVDAKLPNHGLTEDAAIVGAFTTLAASAPAAPATTDPIRDHFQSGGGAVGINANDAAAQEEKALQEANDLNSWRYKKAG